MLRGSLLLFVMIVATYTITIPIRAEENQMEAFKSLKVGMVAPNFTLKDGDSVERSLHDYLGQKNVVLAFYPKDFTGG
ncbi:redoxin domain-containing protein [Candidatus Poribacteria bacterium]|nr:redoxin domain-containing protein [Candidatus Poribacteria bacterium]